jgi:hypothetical protein
MSAVSTESYSFLIPLISILFSFVALVLCLICIWRAEKRLKTFLIMGFVVIALRTARRILEILGLNQSENWTSILTISDLLIGLFFMASFIEMFRIIAAINKQKKGRA